MTAAQPVATKRERAKAATKQGAKKSVETSTLLAFAVPIYGASDQSRESIKHADRTGLLWHWPYPVGSALLRQRTATPFMRARPTRRAART